MQAFCGFSTVFLAFIIPRFDRFCTVYRIIEIIQLALTIAADKPNEAPTEPPNTKPPIIDIFGKDRANNKTKCAFKEPTK